MTLEPKWLVTGRSINATKSPGTPNGRRPSTAVWRKGLASASRALALGRASWARACGRVDRQARVRACDVQGSAPPVAQSGQYTCERQEGVWGQESGASALQGGQMARSEGRKAGRSGGRPDDRTVGQSVRRPGGGSVGPTVGGFVGRSVGQTIGRPGGRSGRQRIGRSASQNDRRWGRRALGPAAGRSVWRSDGRSVGRSAGRAVAPSGSRSEGAKRPRRSKIRPKTGAQGSDLGHILLPWLCFWH